MSFLRRLAVNKLRGGRLLRGEGPKGGFFSEGTHEAGGYIFGETPPPPGQSRKWESWEGPWYFTLGAATAILGIGLNARPDSSISHWADRQAAERLGAEAS